MAFREAPTLGRALKGPPTMDRSAFPLLLHHRYLRARPHCLGHPASRCRSRYDRNGGARHLRALAPQLVGGMISVTRRDLIRPATRSARCAECGALGRVRGWRRRQLQTTCGPIQWERPGLSAGPARQCWSPTDRTLGVPPQQRSSTSLQAWLVSWARCCPSPRPVRSSPR